VRCLDLQKKYWIVVGISALAVFLVTFGFVLVFQNRTDHNPAAAVAEVHPSTKSEAEAGAQAQAEVGAEAEVQAQAQAQTPLSQSKLLTQPTRPTQPPISESELKLSFNAIYTGLLNGLQKGLSSEECASLYDSAALVLQNLDKYSKDYPLAAAIAAVTQVWSGDLSGGLRAVYDLRRNIAAASFMPPGLEKRRLNDLEAFLLYTLARVYEYRDEPAQAMELYQTLSGFDDERIIHLNDPMFSEAPVALFARLRRTEIFENKMALPGAASGELLALAQQYGYLTLPAAYQYADLADYCTERLLAMNIPSTTAAANALKMLPVAESSKYPALVLYSALMYARSGAIDQAIEGLRTLEQTYQGAYGIKRNNRTSWGSYEVYLAIAQALPYSLDKALPIIERVKAVAGPYLRPYILLWQAKALAGEHARSAQASTILRQLLEETPPADMYDYVRICGVDPYQEATRQLAQLSASTPNEPGAQGAFGTPNAGSEP